MINLDELRHKPLAVRRRIALLLAASITLLIAVVGFVTPSINHKTSAAADNSPVESFMSLFSDVKQKLGNPFTSGTPAPALDATTSQMIFQVLNGKSSTSTQAEQGTDQGMVGGASTTAATSTDIEGNFAP